RIKDVNALRITEFRYEQTRELKSDSKGKVKDKDKEKTNDIMGRLTVRGTLVDPKDHAPLDQLIDQFQLDGSYYKLALPPKVEGATFTLTFYVKRHPPTRFERELPPAPKKTTPVNPAE